MQINHCETHLLRLPLPHSVPAPPEGPGRPVDAVDVVVLHIYADGGHGGLGLTYALKGCGRALRALVEDVLTPLLLGENALDHERLARKALGQLRGVSRAGLVRRAFAAVDLALWDLKGKAAGLPVYKLLGGARESSPVYASDISWAWQKPEDIVAAAHGFLKQGMMGVKVGVGYYDPETDADRVAQVREGIGEDAWLGVTAGQRYDVQTALAMGRYFQEELAIDWFEEPIPSEDLAGHVRLARKLDVPLALGGDLGSVAECHQFLTRGAVDVLQPDVIQLGGVTPWLKVAAVAELHHRPLAPHGLPEVGVHLGCGLPGVQAVEYAPWLWGQYADPPALAKGQIIPSARPGLGLEIREASLKEFAVR
jgi:L-alanine-DL-glutamate epimerase-like enolase superfamily enzyme